MEDLEQPRGRGWLGALGVLAVLIGGALVYRFASGPEPLPPAPSASSSSQASLALANARCKPVTDGEGFVVGEKPKVMPAPSAPAEVDSDFELDRDDLLQPFAVVLGRATPFEGGFAFGLMGSADGGNAAFLGTVTSDGASGKTTKLLRLRGDLDPPVVAANGASVYVAMLEPNASSRSIRMARVTGEEVAWGAEIPEDNDPSTAIDIAVTDKRGVVAWDTDDDDTSYVHVAGFVLDSFGTVTATRRATTKELAADSPRVVATKSGFYLAYLAHGREAERDTVVDRGTDAPKPLPSAAPPPSDKKKPKKKKDKEKEKEKGSDPSHDSSDVDETKGGESVSLSWIEVVPLDETGAQASDPIRVTPEGATVISFDIAPGPDNSLVVAYRDDDAPTGGGGGVVHMATVRAGGVGATYESEDPVPSDGVPSVLGGWLAVPTLSGSDFIARLGAEGLPAEPLTKEPSLLRGEPIAASGNRLLITEPEGAAMRFRVVECGPYVAPAPKLAP